MTLGYDVVYFFFWDALTEDIVGAPFEENGLIPIVML